MSRKFIFYIAFALIMSAPHALFAAGFKTPPKTLPGKEPPGRIILPPPSPAPAIDLCKNGKKDAGEEATDCGGKCKPCCAKGETLVATPAGAYKCVPPPPPDPFVILCQQCDTGTTPQDSHCWNISGQIDVSTCTGPDSATYVVCGKNGGKTTATYKPCDPGSICESGVCHPQGTPTNKPGGGSPNPIPQLVCHDTDGTDIHTKGVVTGTDANGRSFSESDYCNSLTTVLEETCSQNRLYSRNFVCPSGEICKDGVCVPGNAPQQTCQDSDGTDIHTKGTVTGTDGNGKSFSESDECIDPLTVRESYCDNNRLSNGSSFCPSGEICKDGECQTPTPSTPPCTCTKTGNSVRDKNCQEHPDICDQKVLIRYRCSATGEHEVESRTPCPNQCVNGVCQ